MAPARRPHRSRRPVRTARARAAALVVAALAVLLTSCGGDDTTGVRPTTTTAAGPASSTTTTTTAADREDPAAPTPEVTVATVPATLDALEERAAAAPPSRLRLPAIGVDVEVLDVGVAPDGEMEVPPAELAGWYRHGPAPGQDGSSVIAAHVDYDGVQGAFFRLRDLRAGDPVEVVAADGSTQRFTVTELRQVDKDVLADTDVFDRSGPPRLALVTCGGEFDRSARSYRDNVVAIAVPT